MFKNKSKFISRFYFFIIFISLLSISIHVASKRHEYKKFETSLNRHGLEKHLNSFKILSSHLDNFRIVEISESNIYKVKFNKDKKELSDFLSNFKIMTYSSDDLYLHNVYIKKIESFFNEKNFGKSIKYFFYNKYRKAPLQFLNHKLYKDELFVILTDKGYMYILEKFFFHD